MDLIKIYKEWLGIEDEDLKNELIAMTEAERKDAFYRTLEFGTGGLRGIMGRRHKPHEHLYRRACDAGTVRLSVKSKRTVFGRNRL